MRGLLAFTSAVDKLISRCVYFSALDNESVERRSQLTKADAGCPMPTALPSPPSSSRQRDHFRERRTKLEEGRTEVHSQRQPWINIETVR